MNYNMNIGVLLDMCGIFYTEEQLTKLEKLVENFIQKILGSNGCEFYENDLQNEYFKEEFEEISLKEELKQNEVNSENKCENTDIVPEVKKSQSIIEKSEKIYTDEPKKFKKKKECPVCQKPFKVN